MPCKLDRVRELYAYGVPIDAISAQVELCVTSVTGIIITDLLHMRPERLTIYEANLCHLVDLKRAGHSASLTELENPPEFELCGLEWRFCYPRWQRVQSGPTVSG